MSGENILKCFVDTDVAFDIISGQKPFYNDSMALLQLVEKGQMVISISESVITNLIYLSFESYKIDNLIKKLAKFITACNVLKSNKQILVNALHSDFKDKEDAIQYYIALQNDQDCIITRNAKDYKKFASDLPIYTPSELLALVNHS